MLISGLKGLNHLTVVQKIFHLILLVCPGYNNLFFTKLVIAGKSNVKKMY